MSSKPSKSESKFVEERLLTITDQPRYSGGSNWQTPRVIDVEPTVTQNLCPSKTVLNRLVVNRLQRYRLGLNYNPNQPRDARGRFGSGGGVAMAPSMGDEGAGSGRASRAKATYKPATAEKQRRGEAEQARLAKALGGHDEGDNLPFDVRVGDHAVEVKTVIDNANDKITMHPDSRRRKERHARKERVKAHTVAIDVRGGRRRYLYREGIGSFRLSAMEQVSLSQLREKLA